MVDSNSTFIRTTHPFDFADRNFSQFYREGYRLIGQMSRSIKHKTDERVFVNIGLGQFNERVRQTTSFKIPRYLKYQKSLHAVPRIAKYLNPEFSSTL